MGYAETDVRYGHKADMLNALTNVRFWGQSGHGADLSVCPLMTQSGRGTKRFGNQSRAGAPAWDARPVTSSSLRLTNRSGVRWPSSDP